MKNQELIKHVHDLTNKICIINGKVNKLKSIANNEQVILETEKLHKSSEEALTILKKIKDLASSE